jgi:ribosomal protein L20
MKKEKIEIDRKILSAIAVEDNKTIKKIVEAAGFKFTKPE